MQEDIIKESQHRILKDCRQQLRAQLYQQRENIHFDPVLQTACAIDIKQFCYNVQPGNSQVAMVLFNTEDDHLLFHYFRSSF